MTLLPLTEGITEDFSLDHTAARDSWNVSSINIDVIPATKRELQAGRKAYSVLSDDALLFSSVYPVLGGAYGAGVICGKGRYIPFVQFFDYEEIKSFFSDLLVFTPDFYGYMAFERCVRSMDDYALYHPWWRKEFLHALDAFHVDGLDVRHVQDALAFYLADAKKGGR